MARIRHPTGSTRPREGRARRPLPARRRFVRTFLVVALALVVLRVLLPQALKAYAGSLGVFTEFAATDGRLEGYVKTLVEDLELVRFAEIDGPVEALAAFWEGLVGLAAEVLENQPRDRLAAIVPVSGRLGSGTDVDLLSVVVSVLRNAFVIALRPALDATIGTGDLQVGDAEGDAASWVRRANLAERQGEEQR